MRSFLSEVPRARQNAPMPRPAPMTAPRSRHSESCASRRSVARRLVRDDAVEPGFAARSILADLGIETEVAEPDAFELLIEKSGRAFPGTVPLPPISCLPRPQSPRLSVHPLRPGGGRSPGGITRSVIAAITGFASTRSISRWARKPITRGMTGSIGLEGRTPTSCDRRWFSLVRFGGRGTRATRGAFRGALSEPTRRVKINTD